MKSKFPLCYGGKVKRDLNGGKFLDKIYISMTFSVLKKPLHLKRMIELYNRSFCAVKGADDLPYLDLFHNIDALSIVRIRNKIIFQRPIERQRTKIQVHHRNYNRR